MVSAHSHQRFAMEYQTERLILKILTPDYAEDVCRFVAKNRASFEPYEPFMPPNYYTASYQHTLLSCELQLALQAKTIRYYVFLKEQPQTIIGTVCLHDISSAHHSSCELGYKFDSEYRHRGYAKEAAAMAVSIAFAALGLHRVYARVMPENTASIRLLKGLFFEEEGIERECICIQGKWQDHLRFSLLNYSSST